MGLANEGLQSRPGPEPPKADHRAQQALTGGLAWLQAGAHTTSGDINPDFLRPPMWDTLLESGKSSSRRPQKNEKHGFKLRDRKSVV